MTWIRPARTILLTGAGFTQTFGGFLANEMWSLIFNQLNAQGKESLRSRMLDELNFEVLYDEVLTSPDYDEGDKVAMKNAVRAAYEHMHRVLCSDATAQRTPAFGACRAFLSRFAGGNQERGYIFTLNQDLFVEKFYQNSDYPVSIPGLHADKWFNDQLRPELGRDSPVTLPDQAAVEQEEARLSAKGSSSFLYIKLHGSLGWVGRDGADVMVIGTTKSAVIQREPLLRWYISLFKEVLWAGDRRLVVIGYGFADEHVNDIISEAVKDRGLRLYVISPLQPREFRARLVPVSGFVETLAPRGAEIWQGLAGYHRGIVTDFYDATAVRLPARGAAFFSDLGLSVGPR